MDIEEFKAPQAEALSALIHQNLVEIISQDYAAEYVASLLDEFTPANIRVTSQTQNTYVAIVDGRIVGTASLAQSGPPDAPKYYGTSVFVAREAHGKGIGRQLMRRVEAKASELGATRLTVRAAVGARGFYRKLGYAYQDPHEAPDDRGNYVMEKQL